MSPVLQIQSLPAGCLNLEAAIRQVTDPEFNFSGHVYTRAFEPQGVPQVGDNELLAASFRDFDTRMHLLPDLRGLQQNDCTQVSVVYSGSQRAVYKITDFSSRHVQIELDVNSVGAGLPGTQRESLAALPSVRKYYIHAASNTELVVVSEYLTAADDCLRPDPRNVRETLDYSWGPMAQPESGEVKIDVNYLARLEQIAGVTEEPAPAGAALISIDRSRRTRLINALRLATHAHCL